MHRRLSAAALALVAALPLAPAPAAATHGGGATCAEAFPLAEVRRGLVGTGFTVARGTVPETFRAEVLGVLDDALGPDRDMIVVETSSPTIDRTGTWFGMSGSPIYVDGKLLGAAAWGVSFGASPLIGVTPGEDVLDVARLGEVAASAVVADEVALSAETRSQLAATVGVSASQVPGAITRLPVPVSISGLSAGRLATVRDLVRSSGQSWLPVSGGAASTPTASQVAAPHLAPGDNLVGALSYGDATLAAVGTATHVCGSTAVGFGHPFTWAGDTTLGANAADAITIVADPVFGAYKMANITAPLGTVDEDRFAGIRARLGPLPTTVPLTSTVTATDLARSRDGRSDVVLRDALPFVAFVHALTNLDVTLDRIGPGSSTVRFDIAGATASGQPWRFVRENRFASPFDITFESINELVGDIAVIQNNPVEDVAIERVDVDVVADREERRFSIRAVELVAPDGSATPLPPFVEFEPGGTIALRVTLAEFRQQDTRTVDLTLAVPDDVPATGGALEVTGGAGGGIPPIECTFLPEACPGAGVGSFEEILATLAAVPRNDELVARLHLFPEFAPPGEVVPFQTGEEPAPEPLLPDAGPDGAVTVEARLRLDRVVSGAVSVPAGPSSGAGGLLRLAGASRYATAVAVSQAPFPTAGTVVVARGDDHADALTAAPLAAAEGGPVLLTPSTGLPPDVAAELARLGATRAVVVGGAAAVGEPVVAELRAAGITEVERIAGADRYDTARLVAERLPGPRAYLVRGTSDGRGWQDAIAASGVAAGERAPILLTEPGRLPAATRTAVGNRPDADVVIVGGPRAIGPTVEEAVRALAPSVQRIAGADRYATSTALARSAVGSGAADPHVAVLATGRTFADGLVAGPLAARLGGVLLLVDGADLAGSPGVLAWLSEHVDAPQTVVLVGGPAAITPAVEEAVAALLGGGAPVPGEEVVASPPG